jgi:hypothetical protein
MTTQTPAAQLNPGARILWTGPSDITFVLGVLDVSHTGSYVMGTETPMVRLDVDGMPRPFKNRIELAGTQLVEVI